jgi:hypothetical protein
MVAMNRLIGLRDYARRNDAHAFTLCLVQWMLYCVKVNSRSLR